MAKLSTPSHKCSIRYVDKDGVPTGYGCPNSAYTRLDGKYLCRPHLQRAKTRAQQKAVFQVVGFASTEGL